MPVHRIPTWLLLVASGVLLGLAYPPNPIGLFGAIGLVPLLMALERAGGRWQAMRWTYLSMLIFSALSSWWIGSWQARADTFLMISCVLLIFIHPLFFVVPVMIYRAVRRATSRYFALAFLPFLWCGGEYLHALGDASYPWLTLGNTQTYNLYYIQFIELTGVWGLSFVLLAQNSLFAAILFSRNDEPSPARRRLRRFSVASLLLLVVAPYVYGLVALSGAWTIRKQRGLMVTVVQPNVDPWEKWNERDTTDHIGLSAGLSHESLRRNKAGMFLWVETAVPQPVTMPGFEGQYERLQKVIDSLGVPVLTGFPDYVRYASSAEAPPSCKRSVRAMGDGRFDTTFYDHFNAAGLFVPGRGVVASYHKMQLVPFGERIPFVDNFPWLISLLSWDVGISTWGKGSRIVTMPVPFGDTVTRAASVVCFESVYPNIVRKFVAEGANFLTVITNDGWYMGTPGPLQHERIAIMRAIETRRSIARAANTGISCFIDPYGSISAELDENVRGTTSANVALNSELTLYVRWGDWWPQLCLVVAGGMIVIAAARRIRSKRARTAAEAGPERTTSADG